jgi:hypothetical protein
LASCKRAVPFARQFVWANHNQVQCPLACRWILVRSQKSFVHFKCLFGMKGIHNFCGIITTIVPINPIIAISSWMCLSSA